MVDAYGFKLYNFKLLILSYEDDQILLAGSENALQKAFYALDINGCSLSMSTEKTELIEFFYKLPISRKII